MPPRTTEFWDFVTTSVPGPEGLKEKGCALCNLTYDLALTNYVLVEGQGASEGEGTSVEDFLTFVLSKEGQADLEDKGYSPLPKSVIKVAERGAEAVTGF